MNKPFEKPIHATRPILPSLNRIISSYGSKVIIKVIYDKLFFDALNT